MAKKKRPRKIWAGWIKLLGFIPVINWLPFLIAGLVVKNKKWIIFSILYVSPLVLLSASILINGDNESEFNELLFLLSWLSWIIALIHTTFIVSKYKVLLRRKREVKLQKIDWLTFNKRDSTINALSHEHQLMIKKILNELIEINRKYHKINPLHQINVMDIVSKLESFIDHATELMKKEEEIKHNIKLQMNILDETMAELKTKID